MLVGVGRRMDSPDQADSAVVLFSPIKTGIAVVAKQTTTVDIQ